MSELIIREKLDRILSRIQFGLKPSTPVDSKYKLAKLANFIYLFVYSTIIRNKCRKAEDNLLTRRGGFYLLK